jgi:hypothetical protein
MQKLLSFILLIAPVAAIAQTTLTYNTHGLKAGEHNTMQPVQYIAPGESGAMQIWDYRSISPLSDGRTETVEQGENGRTSVTSVAGGFFTYNCNENSNAYEGFDAPGRKIVYEQPITKIAYPFSYGSMLSGSFNGVCSYGQNYNMAGYMAGNYSSEGDAYGIMLLPNDVTLHNVLRVKTKESYVEEMCSNVHVEVVKYLWYVQEYRYPVFVTWDITYTYDNGKTHTANESFFTTANLSGIEETPETPVTVDKTEEEENRVVTPEVSYSVYPNPYNSYFHVTYTLEKETLVDIALFSSTGQYITHLIKGKTQNGIQHITYNPRSADLAGFYFLRMTFGDKVYVQPLVKE